MPHRKQFNVCFHKHTNQSMKDINELGNFTFYFLNLLFSPLKQSQKLINAQGQTFVFIWCSLMFS